VLIHNAGSIGPQGTPVREPLERDLLQNYFSSNLVRFSTGIESGKKCKFTIKPLKPFYFSRKYFLTFTSPKYAHYVHNNENFSYKLQHRVNYFKNILGLVFG
jgi:hypothetical protein